MNWGTYRCSSHALLLSTYHAAAKHAPKAFFHAVTPLLANSKGLAAPPPRAPHSAQCSRALDFCFLKRSSRQNSPRAHLRGCIEAGGPQRRWPNRQSGGVFGLERDILRASLSRARPSLCRQSSAHHVDRAPYNHGVSGDRDRAAGRACASAGGRQPHVSGDDGACRVLKPPGASAAALNARHGDQSIKSPLRAEISDAGERHGQRERVRGDGGALATRGAAPKPPRSPNHPPTKPKDVGYTASDDAVVDQYLNEYLDRAVRAVLRVVCAVFCVCV